MDGSPPAKPEWEDVAAAWFSAVALTAVGLVLLGGALWFGVQLVLRLTVDHVSVPLPLMGMQTLLIVLVGVFGGGMAWRGAAIIRRLMKT